MQYNVIFASRAFSFKRTLEKFTQAVNDAIAEGWEPLGGIAFSGPSLAQAMIKRR
jgi:hypothetical protein